MKIQKLNFNRIIRTTFFSVLSFRMSCESMYLLVSFKTSFASEFLNHDIETSHLVNFLRRQDFSEDARKFVIQYRIESKSFSNGFYCAQQSGNGSSGPRTRAKFPINTFKLQILQKFSAHQVFARRFGNFSFNIKLNGNYFPIVFISRNDVSLLYISIEVGRIEYRINILSISPAHDS